VWATLRDNRGSRGFTLIEILFSLVIITGGLIAVTMMLMQASRTERNSRHRLAVSSICQDVLGEMEAADFADITADNPDFSAEKILERCRTAEVARPEVDLTIEPYPDPATAHLKRVAIDVSFGDTNSLPERGRVRYETLLADDMDTMSDL